MSERRIKYKERLPGWRLNRLEGKLLGIEMPVAAGPEEQRQLIISYGRTPRL